MQRLASFFVFTFAAGAAWAPLGPFGGSAEVIVVNPADPNVLVTATKNGLLFRSADKGANWSAVNFSRSFNVSVQALAVSSESVPVFYLGVADSTPGESGMYRSTDGAITWEPVRAFRGRAVYSIFVSKRNPRVVAAGGADGLYLSRDQGGSWRRISRLALEPVTAIALDPQRDDVIYAGTSHLAWKTSDGGTIWTSIHHGMLDDSDMFSFEIDHADPQRVFASACSGVYISNNGGERWSKMTGIPYASRRTYVIRQDPSDRKILYAGTSNGLWKSRDLGATWSRISDARVRSIAFDHAAPAMYLATENAGLLVSHNRGETTQPITGGFANRNVWTIASGASNIYITDGRIHTRQAGQGDWASLDSPTRQSAGNLMGIVEVSPDTLFAYTNTELFRSTTAGRTWSKLQPIARSAQLHVLKFIGGEKPSLLAGASQGLFRSDDSGESWVKAIPDGAPVAAVFGGAASNGAVVVSSARGLLLSSDGGRNWTDISTFFAQSELYDLDINADGVLLAATARGLLRSTDAGKTWARVEGRLGSGTVRHVLFHPARLLAFAVQDAAVHVSEDSGLTWLPLDAQGLESVNIRSLALSRGMPDQLFVLTQAKGVFVSDLSTASKTRPVAADRK